MGKDCRNPGAVVLVMKYHSSLAIKYEEGEYLGIISIGPAEGSCSFLDVPEASNPYLYSY